MPQISVIVPAYKVEQYLHRCIDSILAQTYADFELILVDDGSPDHSPVICDEYAQKDHRVVVIHQANGGLSAARNTGIDWTFANSDSQWLTFIDSDDWIHPEYLAQLLKGAQDHGVSISICAYTVVKGDDCDPISKIPHAECWDTEQFFTEHNINATIACAKLYRKECFQQLRYPLGKLHEDEFTTYRILFQHSKVAAISAPLYYYFQNEQSIVNSAWTMKRMVAYDALEEQISFFKANGYPCAHAAVIRRYLMSITEKIAALTADPSADPQVIRTLKKKKKQNFRQYAKCLSAKNDRDAWVLTKVFPKRMWIYWRLLAIGKKLKMIK